MVIFIDDVKYNYLTPEIEAVLEGQIENNYKHIFGENSIYFPKKKIRSKAGIGTIPDAFIIIPGKKLMWCILEVELASHSVYNHVFPQLTKFRRAIENSSSRKKIRDFFYNTITEDPILEAQFRKQIGSGEIYKSISDMVEEKPMIVVAIDEKTDELGEALLDFGGDVKVIEFKTYRREGCSDEINAYLFELVIPTGKGGKTTGAGPEPGGGKGTGTTKRGRGIKNTIYTLFDEKGVDGVSYQEAEDLAKSIKPNTAFNKGHFSWYKRDYQKSSKNSDTAMKTLPVGLKIFNTYQGKKFTAEVLKKGKILFQGKVCKSPSRAAVAAIQSTGSNRETENGWTWWNFIDPGTGEENPIDVLRKK